MSYVCVVHPSVIYDALRTDYPTPYRDSSKTFLNLLASIYAKEGKKVGYTSGEVFKKLVDSPIGRTKSIWIIPENILQVDFETFCISPNSKIDSSIIKLASKLCIKNTPFIVTTKQNINPEGTLFPFITPKDAIIYLQNLNSPL